MAEPSGAEYPRLTVGMPVYNNAGTIRRALTSLLAQSYPNFRLVISDDGSIDGTLEICDEFAKLDERIRVVRQPKNLNYGNFRYVLQQASTPLFMFAAGDDFWHPDFMQRMIDALDDDPSAVCAISRVSFESGGRAVAEARGTRPLIGSVESKIVRFLAAGDDNSRMYGVFRTPAAQRAFPPRDFYAYDWAFSAGTLRDGEHIEVPDILLYRDHTQPTRYIEYVRRDARNWVERVFPMIPFTRDLVGRLGLPLTAPLARELLRLNVVVHRVYLRRYHPTTARIVEAAITRLASIRARVRRRLTRSATEPPPHTRDAP